jgi:hypothetical protein
VTLQLVENADTHVVRPRPLASRETLPEELPFGSVMNLARWVVYVGLGGRFCFVRTTGEWMRLDGGGWVPCSDGELARAVRRALGEEHDRLQFAEIVVERLGTSYVKQKTRKLTAEESADLAWLMEHVWRPGPLLLLVRRVAAVNRPPMRRYARPRVSKAELTARGLAVTALNNARRLRCECGKTTTPAGMWHHQKATRHTRIEEVTDGNA